MAAPAPAPPLPPSGTPALRSRTARTLLAMLGLGLVVQLAPGLEPLRWFPREPQALLPRFLRPGAEPPEEAPAVAPVDDEALIAALSGAATPRTEPHDHRADPPAPTAAASDPPDAAPAPESASPAVIAGGRLPPPPPVREAPGGLPLLAIEDAQGSMRRFYVALERTAAGEPGAVTRVLHYGDSLVMGDYITQTVRRLLQKQFGDAGHGFVLAGRPWPWYRRNNLALRASEGWSINRLTAPTVRDGAYGLGGATFRTSAADEWVQVEPEGRDGLNDAVGRFQVFYFAGPRGGSFEMRVDGHPPVRVDTRAPEPGSRTAEIELPEGRHRLRLRTLGNGEVRLFGIVLERAGPGVVYDSLGVNGARARLLARYDAAHWHDQIRLRRPDMLVLHYGANESQNPNLGSKTYREDLARTVGHLREAFPGVSCLLVGPMDRAEKGESGELVTREVVKRIAAVQRQVAFEQGCAFWDTYRAMGGEGSMARWLRSGLGGGDLTHPTRAGADRLGAMLFAALMEGYARHARR